MFNHWDLLLIVVVSAQALFVAYVYHPEWKAFIIILPIPFGILIMSVGQPVGISNVLGFLLLYLFAYAVRLLHCRLHLHITAAILLSTLLYIGVARMLLYVLPDSEGAFWLAVVSVLGFAAARAPRAARAAEPGHVTSLPLYVKLPLIFGLVFILVLLKTHLQGFATTFPLVGLLGAYEARRSLYTLTRRLPQAMVVFMALVAVSHLTHPFLGLGLSLAAGWVAAAAVLYPLFHRVRRVAHPRG